MAAVRQRALRCVPVLALFALFAPGLAAQRTLPSPFVALDDQGSHATISFDGTAHAVLDEAHARGELVRLEGFPLPGGDVVELVLRPTRVMPEGDRANVVGPNGELSTLAPTVRTFTGYVVGRAGRAFLAVSPTLLNGYLSVDGVTHIVSNGGAKGGQAFVSDGRLFGGEPLAEFCRVAGTAAGPPDFDPEDATGLAVYTTRVVLELDHQYRALFATDQDAIDYALTLTSAVSEIYRRDLGATLEVPGNYVTVYNSPPPWGVVSTFGDVSKVQSWWNGSNNPKKKRRRGGVHVLTSPVFGGVATSVGPVCRKSSSYAISSVFGSFPTPLRYTSGSNWDPFVLAHEFGHLYGSPHTFEYSPPINCLDGSGPDNGTIMSYCHLTYGTGGVGMRFHERVQDTMRPVVRASSCPEVVPIQLGDYDWNGVLDALDLAELDAYVAQTFVSRGAEETFDMNGDGTVTSRDRDILIARINGEPAASTMIRGTASCLCAYYSVNMPVLGEVWTAGVGILAAPTLTTILGTTAALNPGVQTALGELLIALPGGGVSHVFASSVMTNGQWAYHDLLLPFDITLIGTQVFTQAIVYTAQGPRLTEAIDIVVSVY